MTAPGCSNARALPLAAPAGLTQVEASQRPKLCLTVPYPAEGQR